MTDSKIWDVVVVGGGLAGLAAAATSARAGASTVVLESHDPGGRARVVARDGFRLNMGGHALYMAGRGRAVLRALGVEPTGAPPPLERYRALVNGEQHALPTGPGTMLSTTMLGRRSKAQFAYLLARVPRLKPERLAGLAVSDWLADQDLRPDTDALARALVRVSTYATDLDRVSADAAVSQLQIAAEQGVIYLHRGWSQLVDGLAASVNVRAGVKVTGIESASREVAVMTTAGPVLARQVVLAVGTPAAARALLPADPGWGELGEPVTAACLDVGVRRIPEPGYVLGIDDPVYGTTQSPPADQAPPGQAVVAVIRYGARSAEEDRAQLERHLSEVGVRPEDVVVRRFLARMVVAGSSPSPMNGGLRGRPAVTATGLARVTVAGDWVGPEGLLADAALASGHAAARTALWDLSLAPTIAA